MSTMLREVIPQCWEKRHYFTITKYSVNLINIVAIKCLRIVLLVLTVTIVFKTFIFPVHGYNDLLPISWIQEVGVNNYRISVKLKLLNFLEGI